MDIFIYLEIINDKKIHYTYDSSNNLISMNITSTSNARFGGINYRLVNLQGGKIGLIDIVIYVFRHDMDFWRINNSI